MNYILHTQFAEIRFKSKILKFLSYNCFLFVIRNIFGSGESEINEIGLLNNKRKIETAEK